MSQLPQFVRRLPYVFYILAVILGLWRFFNEWSVAEATYAYTEGLRTEFDLMHFMSRSNALYWGITEAAYMLANGAVVHVLVAIYDKVRGPAQ